MKSFVGAVQSRLKWIVMLRRFNAVFEDINQKYQRHAIIITDLKILEEKLLEFQKMN